MKTIVLTSARMQQIARYELTFKELIADTAGEDIDIVCPESFLLILRIVK